MNYLEKIQEFGEYMFNYVNDDGQGNSRNLFERWFLGESFDNKVISVNSKERYLLNFDDTIGNYFYLRMFDSVNYRAVEETNGAYSSCATNAFDMLFKMRLVALCKSTFDTGQLEFLFRNGLANNSSVMLRKFEPSTLYNFIVETQSKDVSKLDGKLNIISFDFDLFFRMSVLVDKSCDLESVCKPCVVGRPESTVTNKTPNTLNN